VIAGEDRKFAFATAVIDGDSVTVSSPAVPKPVAVRYGWADLPKVNLFGKNGYPVSTFRTDDWPLN
jgi:sialate O-acetylesterase